MRSSIFYTIVASCVAVQAAPGNTTASAAWPVVTNATVTIYDPQCGCTKTAVAPPAYVSPTLPAAATGGYVPATPSGQAPFTGDATRLTGAGVSVGLAVAMLALGL